MPKFLTTVYSISVYLQRLVSNIVKINKKTKTGIYAQNQHFYQNKPVMTQGLTPTQFKLIFLSNCI